MSHAKCEKRNFENICLFSVWQRQQWQQRRQRINRYVLLVKVCDAECEGYGYTHNTHIHMRSAFGARLGTRARPPNKINIAFEIHLIMSLLLLFMLMFQCLRIGKRKNCHLFSRSLYSLSSLSLPFFRFSALMILLPLRDRHVHHMLAHLMNYFYAYYFISVCGIERRVCVCLCKTRRKIFF